MTDPDPVHDRAQRRKLPGPWLGLVVACVVVIGAIETVLFEMATSSLTEGYNTPRIGVAQLVLGFLPGSLLLDLWLVLMICTAAVLVLPRLTRSPLRTFAGVALCGGAIPLALVAVRYNLYATLGSRFRVAMLSQGSTLGPSGMLAELLSEAPGLPVGATAFAALVLVCFAALGQLERRVHSLASFDAPPTRVLALGALAAGVAGALVLGLTAAANPALYFAFGSKLSGSALSELFERVTDLDADGAGLFATPRDPAPFDSHIHPYAIDEPGNGVDENGLAGDHPVDAAAVSVAPAPGSSAARPHVLLVLLESFRSDLLGARLRGREITPFLNRLARDGASSQRAYVHSPWTLASRAQLLSGRLLPIAGDPTLVDDFKSRGYTVAWFSGQDDSYGDSASQLGAHRADVFYDARQDVTRRTSRSIQPIGLQVSWKTLTQRTLDFLAKVDPRQPIFLYLNVVDTHYPYTHSEVDPMLDGLPPSDTPVRASRAREIFEIYANTAANVDRAVETAFDALRARIGAADLVVIVTADHGQAFYEYGTLGHGQTLDPRETNVPWIVWGIGGSWPEPIAPTDLRASLLGNLALAGPGAVARFTPDPPRQILQYVPSLTRPTYIALRGRETATFYDFARDEVSQNTTSGNERSSLPRERGDEVIRRWETLQRQASLNEATRQR